MFADAYAHEQKVTALIHDMASLALELKDHATYQFLQWFIAEQVEEEATASDMLQKFTMAEKDAAGLYQLDKELGDARVRLADGLRLVGEPRHGRARRRGGA